MAYVLGFFAADGYITVNKRGANFWCIQITDKKLLESIKKVVGAEHKISVRPPTGNEKILYRLQIGSREMCDDLRKLGYAERKSKNLPVPLVPHNHLCDFVRGYFDGDGNVWTGQVKKEKGRSNQALTVAFTSGSRLFLKELWRRLQDGHVKGGCLYISKKRYARLQFSTRDSLKLHDFMYNQVTRLRTGLFLSRKKKVFQKFKKLRV
jgi:hypothetical protein